MRHFVGIVVLVLALLPGVGSAQDYPRHENIYVNDYAGVLDAGARTRLTRAITGLRDDTGVELTILTLTDRAGYAHPDDFEAFATGLFNDWGIGDASRNDGILILVVTGERKMRIELGAGYPSGYDNEAARIIRTSFLPAFKAGDYQRGIEEGTALVIDQIARRFASGQAAPDGSGGKPVVTLIVALLALGGVGLAAVGWIRGYFRRCPACGARGLRVNKRTLTRATRSQEGAGERQATCRQCGYSDTSTYIIPIVSDSSSSGGSFGGGSSAGGGASGSW